MAAFAGVAMVRTLLPPGAAIAVTPKAAVTPKGAPETETAIEEEVPLELLGMCGGYLPYLQPARLLALISVPRRYVSRQDRSGQGVDPNESHLAQE